MAVRLGAERATQPANREPRHFTISNATNSWSVPFHRWYRAMRQATHGGRGRRELVRLSADEHRRRNARGAQTASSPRVKSYSQRRCICEKHIRTRVTGLQEEQLAIHQQATAAAAANKQVTIESLIAEAEAARAKAMSEKGGAGVPCLTLRTCRLAFSKSTCSQRRSTSCEALTQP